MSFTVSKDTSFASGSISLSAIRNKFLGSGQISLSELKRQTSLDLEDPTIPDATENSNISTTDSNIKFSNYRNSITHYKVVQSGTDTNVDIDSLSWNNNLSKNIPKEFIVNGTCGSTDTSSEAATFNADAFNLSFFINGAIEGAGGAGGTVSSRNGGNGGNALSVTQTSNAGTNQTRQIKIYNSGNCKAGGGGGGCGADGGDGGTGGSVVGLNGAGGTDTGGAGGAGGTGQGFNQSDVTGSEGSDGSQNQGDETTYLDLNRNSQTYSAGDSGIGGKGGTGGNGGTFGSSGNAGATGNDGATGNSTTSFRTYVLGTSGTVTFGLFRDANFNIRTRFGNSFPGGEFSKSGNGHGSTTRSVSAGVYAPVYSFDSANRGLKGILLLTRSGSYNQSGRVHVSVDDAGGGNEGFDYTDLEVGPSAGILYDSFSVAGSSGSAQLGNQGQGGNPGTAILGSNFSSIT
jgi:hypothetical protein